MHKNSHKIKAAFLCDENFNNSINELKPFLSFDLIKIQPENDPNSINLENEVFVVDASYVQKFPIKKINIPSILILGQSERNAENNKFNIILKLPLSIIEFNRKIVDLSQKHKFDQNSVITVKNYILDKNERFLRSEKKSVKVTEKEMHFIEELNNCSEPLSKDYILKNIWGYSSETDTHTVETHIYRLRQKIKNQFDDKNFIKHTKKGYSI